MRPLCIYHANCADGFAAAWVVWKFFGGDVDFHPGVYQTTPPDVTDRDVILVDFSYKLPVLVEMGKIANTILVLDHHKTAAADLAPLPKAPPSQLGLVSPTKPQAGASMAALFDMERSGAGIAWDFFFQDEPRPPLIDHIEDRDLWRFAIPGTRAIQAALFSFPYDFEIWDGLINDSRDPAELDKLRIEGEAIERKHHKDVAELVGVMRRTMKIGGLTLPVANIPYTLTSDAGHLMATKHEGRIGVCYWDTPDGRIFSLRSTDDGPDVSEIAKRYGGGGHAHAAGFKAALGWEGDAV